MFVSQLTMDLLIQPFNPLTLLKSNQHVVPFAVIWQEKEHCFCKIENEMCMQRFWYTVKLIFSTFIKLSEGEVFFVSRIVNCFLFFVFFCFSFVLFCFVVFCHLQMRVAPWNIINVAYIFVGGQKCSKFFMHKCTTFSSIKQHYLFIYLFVHLFWLIPTTMNKKVSMIINFN